MTDYRQSDIAGTKHQRACRVVIENPIDETPSVLFVEEEIITLPGAERIHRLVGGINIVFDPDELITMVDPETNSPTETVYPASLAHWIIYSMYWKKAAERDAQNQ